MASLAAAGSGPPCQVHFVERSARSVEQQNACSWMILSRRVLSGLVAVGVAATLHGNGGRRRHQPSLCARRSHPRLSRLDGLDAAASKLLPHHAAGRRGVDAGRPPGQPRAILYQASGLALRLQAAGNALSDALDEEEEINQEAGIPYSIDPCPTPPAPYPARPAVLRIIGPRAPTCRRVRLSFDALRALMQRCLRIPGT
jgi:hypothetical protein